LKSSLEKCRFSGQHKKKTAWDSTIENWINGTGKKSAAFDFQFRYNVRDAVNNNDWSKLNSTNNLVHDANYRQYAVTFVENHDTQYRSATETLDPIKKDTLATN
jgi:alpha-amylase